MIYIILIMSKLGVDIARCAVKVFGRLPLKVHYFFADFVAWMAGNVLRYRSDVVMINLARSFPEKKYGELVRIKKEFYRHFAEIFAEAVWFGASDYKRLNESGIVEIVNPEVFNEYMASAENTTLLFSHCGNWEILGGMLGYRTANGVKLEVEEEQIKVVYKGLHSALANEFFLLNRVTPLEKVGKSCQIEASMILRYALKHKDDRNLYIYIADQYPYRTPFDVGTFLNQPTNAMLGAAGVACKLAHSVVYMKMKRVERGKYQIVFVPVCKDASEFTPEEIIRKYFDILEEEIRETPANWLWSHKRWKK